MKVKEQSEKAGLKLNIKKTKTMVASQVALVVKNLPANAGDVRDMGSIPGLGRYS